MKKVIFDLDNTLMMFDEIYLKDYSAVIKGTYEDGIKLYNSIGKYEKNVEKYNKNEMLDFINKDLNTSYTIDTFNKLLDVISNKWVCFVPSGIEEVLKYLSKKYELYVLTNWFSECQGKRLENVGLLKYFKEVVGADKVKPKPNIDGYLYIIGNSKKEDVIMIGDNPDIDIKGAKDAGCKWILADYRNKYIDFENRITDIRELMNKL